MILVVLLHRVSVRERTLGTDFEGRLTFHRNSQLLPTSHQQPTDGNGGC